MGLKLGAPGIALALLLAPGFARADAPVATGGTRIDGIAAAVGGAAPGPGVDVVLVSDVELRARLAMAHDTPSSIFVRRIPRAVMRATLDQLVGELLIAREAERVRVTAPTDAQVARERERLEQEAGGAARLAELLAHLGGTAEELDTMALRRAQVAAFLQANLEGATVVVDEEVERVFATGEHPFADQPLEDVREVLRAWIARRILDRTVRRWVNALRARTTVRILVTWGVERTGPRAP